MKAAIQLRNLVTVWLLVMLLAPLVLVSSSMGASDKAFLIELRFKDGVKMPEGDGLQKAIITSPGIQLMLDKNGLDGIYITPKRNLKRSDEDKHYFTVVSADRDVDKIAQAFRDLKEVALVYVSDPKVYPTVAVNDPFFTDDGEEYYGRHQWYFERTESDAEDIVADMNFHEAWNYMDRGEGRVNDGIVVGVIDSGIQPDHPEFEDNVAGDQGYNNDLNSDWGSHGSAG